MQHDRTIITVRNRLNEKIGHLLGVFKNGARAIAVSPPMPPDFGQGIHCIIERHNRRKGLSSICEWQVAIVLAPTGNEVADEQYHGNYDQCIYEMRYWFPQSRELHSTYLDFYPQATFYLTFEKEEFTL